MNYSLSSSSSPRSLEEALSPGGFNVSPDALTLPKARYARRLWEMSSAAGALFVTALIAAAGIGTRIGAYALLLFAGLFLETTRRGVLAISARQIRTDNVATEPPGRRREI